MHNQKTLLGLCKLAIHHQIGDPSSNMRVSPRSGERERETEKKTMLELASKSDRMPLSVPYGQIWSASRQLRANCLIGSSPSSFSLLLYHLLCDSQAPDGASVIAEAKARLPSEPASSDPNGCRIGEPLSPPFPDDIPCSG